MAAFVRRLKHALTEKDHVDVITTLPNRYATFKNKAAQSEQDGIANIIRIDLPSHKSGMADQSLAFLKFAINVLVQTRGKRYDLVFATSSRLLTAFLGAIIARKQKVPLYLDIRDIFTDTMKEVLKNRKTALFLPAIRKIERFTMEQATRINLVSNGFNRYFSSRFPGKSLSFIPNGIDNEFLKFDFTKTDHQTKKIIVYAGNIGEGQGLYKIVPQIAKRLNNRFEFRVIGDGGQKAELIKYICDLEAKNVILIDPVSRKLLLEHYRQSDYLFLHLNDYEAFKKVLPSKIFEYAATGKTIIAGVSGYAKDFINQNLKNSIVFEPCNVNDFIAKFSVHRCIEEIPSEFVNRFSRDHLMDQLARDVVSCCKEQRNKKH